MEAPDQSQQDAFATHSQLGLPQPPTQTVLGILPSLQKYRWIPPLCNLMLLEYIVHGCPLQLCTPVWLMCQAIGSTQSSNPSCPFPPPGRRQGPSIPCQSLHHLIFVTAKQKSLHQGPKYNQPFYSAQPALEQSFSWMDVFWLLFFLADSVPSF